MISEHILRLCATSLLCVLAVSAGSDAYAQDSAGLADRVFKFLDKNGNGELDSKEFAIAPVTMRTWLTQNRHKPNPTLKKADFVKVFGTMMADLRKAKPAVTTQSNGDTSTQTTGASGSNGTNSLYVSGQEPVEVGTTASPTDRLPAEYQPGDTNKDGQIDFAEWRKWKSGELARFKELDKNSDAVLSPVELGASPTKVASSGSNSNSTSSKPVEIVPYDKLSDDLKKKFGEVIKKAYFDYLDENKSGKLEPKEWEASERISKAFEDKKVDLSKDMTPEQFVTHYSTIIGTSNTGVWKEYLQKNPPKTETKTDDSKQSANGDKTAKSGDSKSGGDSYESLSSEKKEEYRKLIKGYFEYLDANKDGKLQEKEWDASRRIKPVFVKAKIDLKKEMNEADFISQYTKLVGTEDRTWRRNNRGSRDRRRR